MDNPYAGPIDFEPSALVERFSWEVEGRHPEESDTEQVEQLRSDFIGEKKRKTKEIEESIKSIEAHFGATRTDDAVSLSRVKQKLLQAMQRFQDLVPDHSKTSNLPTSWDDVWAAAVEAQSRWEAKAKDKHVGRAKEWIRKMCNSMNNHSMALKMLPSESEYFSLLAGSVSMIVKASANYISISESFAKGIVEINDAVKLEHISHVYESPPLQQITMRLYAQIFTYLIKFMTWYTDRSRTRFLNSFKEQSHKIFQEDLNEVKNMSNLLSRHIQMHMSADVRISRLRVEDMQGDIDYLLTFAESWQRDSKLRDAANAELLRSFLRGEFEKRDGDLKEQLAGLMGEYHERTRAMISGDSMSNLLEQQAIRNMQQSHGIILDATKSMEYGMQMNADNVNDKTQNKTTATDIRLESCHLENYFTWEHVHPFVETPLPLLAEATFVARLNYFTTTMVSQVLYAYGPYQHEGAHILKQSTIGYTALAREAGVPVISYFCQLSNEEPPANRTRESVELSGLLYAMIRQIIELLPTDLSPVSLSSDMDKLSTVDGTLRTWSEALGLFESLVHKVSLPILLFVVDGINLLEDDFERTGEEELESFVECLVRLACYGTLGEDKIVKVLFTTSGISETASKLLEEDDIVSCNNGPPGRPRRGRQAFFY